MAFTTSPPRTETGALNPPQPGQAFEDWVSARSVYELLQQAAADSPQRPALSFVPSGEPDSDIRTLNYRELFEGVTRSANTFRRLGARRGDGVAYLLPLLTQTQFILWGAATAATAVPLNPLLQTEELAALCEAANVTVLVALGPVPGSDIWTKAQQVRALVPGIRVLMCVGEAPRADPAVLSFADEMAASAPALAFDDAPGMNDVAACFHTGGTTGAPKLVVHTHRNQLAAAYGGACAAGIDSNDVIVNGLPMFHVASTIFCSLGIFAARGHVALLSPAGFRNAGIVSNFWRIVERTGATIVGGVPTALAAVVKVPADTADLSKVRVNISGAASMPGAVALELERITGKPVREVYGMTESGGVICVDPVAQPRVLGSAGLPIAYCEVRARRFDADGVSDTECACGESGVLVVRGPNITSGYTQPAQSAKLFTRDGWLITGDIGHIQSDGHVFITGRAKDVIIRSGHNIDPSAIEEKLLSHPDVVDAAAVGMPDSHAGEVPVAYVKLRADARVTEAQLLAFAKERIQEPPALPRHIFVIDQIPVTAVGKPFKPALRRDSAQRHLTDLLKGEPIEELRVEDDTQRGRVVQIRLRESTRAQHPIARERIAQQLGAYAMQVDWL